MLFLNFVSMQLIRTESGVLLVLVYSLSTLRTSLFSGTDPGKNEIFHVHELGWSIQHTLLLWHEDKWITVAQQQLSSRIKTLYESKNVVLHFALVYWCANIKPCQVKQLLGLLCSVSEDLGQTQDNRAGASGAIIVFLLLQTSFGEIIEMCVSV